MQMKNAKQQLIELIENLSDSQVIYALTLLKKLFGGS